MEIREKLLRNELRQLAEDLRAVSQELIILQDFVRKEYDSYIQACSDEDAEEQSDKQSSRNKRQKSVDDDPDFNPSQFLKVKKSQKSHSLNSSGIAKTANKKQIPIGNEENEAIRNTKKNSYEKVGEYSNLEEAKVEVLKKWASRSSYTSVEGTRLRYSCRFSSRKCPKYTYLFVPSDYEEREGIKISRWETIGEHRFHSGRIRGLDPKIQEAITELYKSGVKKSNELADILSKRGVDLPMDSGSFKYKFANFCTKLRRLNGETRKRQTKHDPEHLNPVKRKRGRPKKSQNVSENNSSDIHDQEEDEFEVESILPHGEEDFRKIENISQFSLPADLMQLQAQAPSLHNFNVGAIPGFSSQSQ